MALAIEQSFSNGELLTSPNVVFHLLFDTGYAFSAGEVMHARVECSPNMALSVAGSELSAAGSAFGKVNGNRSNVVRFLMTATAAVPTNTAVTLAGTRTFTSRDAVACQYSLYGLPSQAAAGGAAGRITSTEGPYARFASSYRYEIAAGVAVADVDASPSFAGFVTAGNPTGLATRAALATIDFYGNGFFANDVETRLASGAFANIGSIIAVAPRT